MPIYAISATTTDYGYSEFYAQYDTDLTRLTSAFHNLTSANFKSGRVLEIQLVEITPNEFTDNRDEWVSNKVLETRRFVENESPDSDPDSCD